jgi:hypothetical protein
MCPIESQPEIYSFPVEKLYPCGYNLYEDHRGTCKSLTVEHNGICFGLNLTYGTGTCNGTKQQNDKKLGKDKIG